MLSLVQGGDSIIVETFAAHIFGIDDAEYQAAGASIAGGPNEVFTQADMIIKVKELQASEFCLLREDQILFTYLHLAPDPAQTPALINSGCVAIAYETVTDEHGGLPLLAPMSEVAGRMAVQAGANCLEISRGGRGMLLGGVPGVQPGKVVVIGGGVVGTNSVFVAKGFGASVTVIDSSLKRLSELDFLYQSALTTLYSSSDTI